MNSSKRRVSNRGQPATVRVITNSNMANPQVTRRRNRRRRGRRATANPQCTDNGRDFFRCAIDPFGSDSARVPDGNGERTVHIKYTTFAKFSPREGATTASVACVPALPGALVAVDGLFTLSDRTGAIGTIAVEPSGTDLIVPFADFYTSGTDQNILPNLSTQIIKARVVSYGMEVTPSATIVNQGGIACTARFPMKFPPENVVESVGATVYGGITVVGGDTVVVRATTPAPTGFQQLQQFPDVKMCSGVESCRLIGAPDDYEWDPVVARSLTSNSGHTNETVVFHGAGLAATTTGSLATVGDGSAYLVRPVPNDTGLEGWFWISERCPGLAWCADSLAANMSFEVKVVLCLEIVIGHGAIAPTVYRPFVTMPPPEDQLSIDQARNVLRQMPPSVPSPSTGASWWTVLSESITGIGDVVSSMGIPFVSGAANLATRFARLLG